MGLSFCFHLHYQGHGNGYCDKEKDVLFPRGCLISILGARPPSVGSSHQGVNSRLEDDIGFVKSPEDTEYNQETIPVSGGDGETLKMRPATHPFGVPGEEEDEGDGNTVHLGAGEAASGSPNREVNLANDDQTETGVGGKVLPSPEPADLIAEQDGGDNLPSSAQHSAGQDGNGGLADHSISPAGSWTFTQFVDGFGEEQHESALEVIYKRFQGEEKFGGRGLLSEDRAAAASAIAAVAVVWSNAPNAIVGEWLEHAKPKEFVGTDFEFAKSIGPNFPKQPSNVGTQMSQW